MSCTVLQWQRPGLSEDCRGRLECFRAEDFLTADWAALMTLIGVVKVEIVIQLWLYCNHSYKMTGGGVDFYLLPLILDLFDRQIKKNTKNKIRHRYIHLLCTLNTTCVCFMLKNKTKDSPFSFFTRFLKFLWFGG